MEGGGGVTVEKDDLRCVNALAPHGQPCVKQRGVTRDEHLGIGNVQENEVHACLLQHVCMLAVDPGVGVAVVAKVGLCPVSLTAALFNVFLGVAVAHFEVELGVILHDLPRAHPAKEVEKSHVSLLVGVACHGIVRGGAVKRVGCRPGGVIDLAQRVGCGNVPGLLHVCKAHVVHKAPNVAKLQAEVACLVQLAGVGFCQHLALRIGKCKVAGGRVGNHGDQLIACVQGNGVKCLVQRDGGFAQIRGKRQRCLQSAFRLKYAQIARRVKGKPNAAFLVRNGGLRVAHAKIDRAARQGEVKGKVALLQSVLVTKAECRAKGKAFPIHRGQRTVHDLRACAVAHRQRGIAHVGVDALYGKIKGVG